MDKVPCEKRRKEMGRVIPYMASDTLWGELVERHCDWMQYPVKMQSSAPEIALFVNTLMSARLFSFISILFTKSKTENYDFFSKQISKILN